VLAIQVANRIQRFYLLVLSLNLTPFLLRLALDLSIVSKHNKNNIKNISYTKRLKSAFCWLSKKSGGKGLKIMLALGLFKAATAIDISKSTTSGSVLNSLVTLAPSPNSSYLEMY
jgi:hypothetical protein